jgi:hypothetical protein
MTFLCEKKITVAKSKELKTRLNLEEFSKEGYSSYSAVLPMIMICNVTCGNGGS